jgi:CDP-glycerol glycerophosphotransferase
MPDFTAPDYAKLTALGMLHRRRRNLVIFAGRTHGRLIDNVKYAYLYAATHNCGFEAWFLTQQEEEAALLESMNLPVLTLDAQGVKMLTIAGMLVMDDLPHNLPEAYCLAIGAKKMQLWHGIPLKKIGFPETESAVNMTPQKAESLRNGYSGADIVASTSPWVTQELFSKVFKASTFMEHGYPRNDILLRPPDKFDFLNVDVKSYAAVKRHKDNGGRVVVYMPTFRDTGLDFIGEDGACVLDPEALAEYAGRHNTLFVLKLHPYVQDARLSGNVPGLMRYPSHQDIYPVLPLADALITDYSSVYFDFLLLGKPILFFPYDRDRYINQDRELFFSYESMTPGPTAATQGELLERLSELADPAADAAWAEQRQALRDRLFTHCDALASERICRHIRAVLRGEQA